MATFYDEELAWWDAHGELSMMPPKVRMLPQHSSKSSEHFTPSFVVEAARACMGSIDLDPASCAEANLVVEARHYYSKAEDGLQQRWHGNTWINPPGGVCPQPFAAIWQTRSHAVAWWRKLMNEYDAGRVAQAIFLGFSAEILQTSQHSEYRSCLEFPICVPAKRLCFSGSDPTHANAIIGVGVNHAAFKACFEPIGAVKL